jgi:hypothetical protein
METTENRTNYAFRFYNEYDKLIDTLEGPGHIGNWLGGPDSPFYAAILPTSFEEVSRERNPELLTKTIRIPLDEKGRPKETASEEFVLYEAEDLEDARELAMDLGCDYIYWIEWVVARVISVIDPADPDSEVMEYYFLTDV